MLETSYMLTYIGTSKQKDQILLVHGYATYAVEIFQS